MKHYRFRKLDFWAERGLINLVDERFPPEHPRAFVVILVSTWLKRLKGLNDELHRWNRWPDEREEMANFIDNGITCAREATKQGRPDDPKAVADVLKSRRRMYALGNGQQTELHTVAASSVPEGLLLPEMPIASSSDRSEKKLIIP